MDHRGRALIGPLQDHQFNALDGYVVEWHVWARTTRQRDPGCGRTRGKGPAAAPAFPDLTLVSVNGGVPGRSA